MAMQLTKDDLNAIRGVVEDVVETKLEEKLEIVMQQTAAGFAEVHSELQAIRDTVDRIERIQHVEAKRVDGHAEQLKRINTAFKQATA